LYENAKQKDTLQKLNQALVEESFKSLTFNPSIPAASKEIILQKYQQKQQQLQIQDQDSIAGTQNVIINYLCWLQSTFSYVVYNIVTIVCTDFNEIASSRKCFTS
jgi:hypothetical protein